MNDSGALIPIVIGVTGHRDLRSDDVIGLERKVSDTLKQIKDRYPDSPVIMLSSLAEGADRLAARVALGTDCQLVVPLPIEQEEYRKDFKGPGSRKEFEELLSKASHWFVASGERNKGRASREEFYRAAGEYIAGHSHILIALWDGVVTGKPAGTSSIVAARMGKEVRKERRKFLEADDSGVVYHILTPRQSNPAPSGQALTLNILSPESREGTTARGEKLEQSLKRIDEFNRNSIKHEHQSLEARRISRGYLLPGLDGPDAPEYARSIGDRFALADVLSQLFQKRRHQSLLLIFLTFIFAFSLLEFYEYFNDSLLAHWHYAHWLLPGYIALLGIAYMLFVHAQGRHYQDNHLDYRALAEGLRVQLFWKLAGLSHRVFDHYLGKHSGEMLWLRDALKGWSVDLAGQEGTGPDMKAIQTVRDAWVMDQLKYFRKAEKRSRHKMEKMETAVNAFFIMAVLLAAAMFVFNRQIHGHIVVHGALGYAISIAFAIAAAVGGYAQKMVYAEQTKAFARMVLLYDQAAAELDGLMKSGDRPGILALLKELGQEALAENADWLLLHRSRPLEVPKGG
jgi:uncharacterized MnhB-related membrane protein